MTGLILFQLYGKRQGKSRIIRASSLIFPAFISIYLIIKHNCPAARIQANTNPAGALPFPDPEIKMAGLPKQPRRVFAYVSPAGAGGSGQACRVLRNRAYFPCIARYRKVTIWPRVQVSSGPKVVAVIPLVTSFSTAQATAFS